MLILYLQDTFLPTYEGMQYVSTKRQLMSMVDMLCPVAIISCAFNWEYRVWKLALVLTAGGVSLKYSGEFLLFQFRYDMLPEVDISGALGASVAGASVFGLAY